MVSVGQELECSGFVSTVDGWYHHTYMLIISRADDAMTDVIFNTGSILFPIGTSREANLPTNFLLTLVVGFYAKIWWLDALGGLVLSLVVIFNWSRTSLQHIKNLSGFSATADQRNICKSLPFPVLN